MCEMKPCNWSLIKCVVSLTLPNRKLPYFQNGGNSIIIFNQTPNFKYPTHRSMEPASGPTQVRSECPTCKYFQPASVTTNWVVDQNNKCFCSEVNESVVIYSDSNIPRNEKRQEQKGNVREFSRLQQFFRNAKIDGVQSQSVLKLLPVRWANKDAAKTALTKVKHASTPKRNQTTKTHPNATKRPKRTQTHFQTHPQTYPNPPNRRFTSKLWKLITSEPESKSTHTHSVTESLIRRAFNTIKIKLSAP